MSDKFDPSTIPAFNTPGLSEAAALILSTLAAHRSGVNASAAEVAASDLGYVLSKLTAFGA